ncbi:MAG TPA: diacylglycerol kinase family protein, partial [Longimicrobium sp.]|nr:diacylglycerol kinase family protein [Longimicrobium sp.]
LAGKRTALAVFPAGTLNHFARALGIGDHRAAARALAAREIDGVDVGEVNGRVFVNGVSFGLYPQMLRLRERWEPRIGKWPAALYAAGRAVAEFPHGPLWRDAGDAASRYPLVWVGAGRGSFRSPRRNPRELRSGVLELVIVSTHSRSRILRLARTTLMRGLDGLTACEDSPGCTVQEVTEFQPPDPLPSVVHAGLDGELVRLHPPLRFRVRPRALRVVCPSDAQDPAR